MNSTPTSLSGNAANDDNENEDEGTLQINTKPKFSRRDHKFTDLMVTHLSPTTGLEINQEPIVKKLCSGRGFEIQDSIGHPKVS